MRIEKLSTEKINNFVVYCRKHRKEVDDSFLYDEDLQHFKPDDENLTYIVTNERGELAAAASLMIDEYHKRARKARFRIFHSEVKSIEIYQRLMQEILNHTKDLDKVFVFIPMMNETLKYSIEALKFTVERYSFLLVRDDLKVPEFRFPDGYEIKPLQLDKDEEHWCAVRNAAFATLQGSETPITPEMVRQMVLS